MTAIAHTAPVHITDDIMVSLAEYIRDNRDENTFNKIIYTEDLRIKSDIYMAFDLDLIFHIHPSYEEWGKEEIIRTAVVIWAECRTYDDDGNLTLNDFSIDKLKTFLKDF